MGTAFRNPGQMIALACDDANVLEGAAIFQGAANDTCALPAAANTREKFLGLAYEAGSSSANQPLTIIINGVGAAIAAGTITRGDKLVVGAATGTLAAESLTTPADATRVGFALESCLDGERFAVLIGEAAAGRGIVIPFTASGAITANRAVVAAGTNLVSAPGGADPVEGAIGVALNTVTDGQTVYVCTHGVSTVTDSGAGVTAGDNLAIAGVTGTAKTAAPSAGANTMCLGTALSTTAAGQPIPVMVNVFMLQGA